MTRFVNFLLYQVGWFGCVLGAAWGFPVVGTSFALLLLAIHLALANHLATQIKLLVLAGTVGLLVDTCLLNASVFEFPRGTLVEWLPPPWMSVLWMQFGSTFHYSMHWLARRYRLCAVFGFAGAPLAFFAGERLGAILFLPPRVMNYLILAVLWSAAVPFLVYLSDRLAAGDERPADYKWLSPSGDRRN